MTAPRLQVDALLELAEQAAGVDMPFVTTAEERKDLADRINTVFADWFERHRIAEKGSF